jgi:cytochrome c5
MKSKTETRLARKCIIFGSAILLLQALPAAEAQAGQPKVSTRQGKRTYDQACIECHGEGKNGAPRLDVGFSKRNPDWKQRTFDAQAVLDQHKQKEYIQIPAKAGSPKLADQDVINAVHWMMIMLRTEPVR